MHVITHHCIVLRPKQGICTAPHREAANGLQMLHVSFMVSLQWCASCTAF